VSVLLLSGGLDSTVLLAWEVADGNRPYCVGFDYGQRHRKELLAARKIAAHYGCHYIQEPIPRVPLGGGCIGGDMPVPHAHYADPVQSITVVPNRNMVMLSVAAAIAVRHRKDRVIFAAHRGDSAIYPDCRPEFVAALDAAMSLGCGVRVEAPFLEKTKRKIVELGHALSVPFDLTWTCYEGGESPCGKCGACCEREEALS
jgi:7-cyano-7-deazaguanine synthase